MPLPIPARSAGRLHQDCFASDHKFDLTGQPSLFQDQLRNPDNLRIADANNVRLSFFWSSVALMALRRPQCRLFIRCNNDLVDGPGRQVQHRARLHRRALQRPGIDDARPPLAFVVHLVRVAVKDEVVLAALFQLRRSRWLSP